MLRKKKQGGGLPFLLDQDSRGKGKFYLSDTISATEIQQCLRDHGTENPQKTRGNTAEMPREVKFLAISHRAGIPRKRESKPCISLLS